MDKKTLGLSIILLSGCSTLSMDDDFSDAISSVDKRADYISVQAKGVVPRSNESTGGNAISNITNVVANFPLKSMVNVPSSYMKVELKYIKARSEFRTVAINGQELQMESLTPSDETCSEHCTITQYLTFPIENELIEKSAQTGLTYVVSNDTKTSQLSFSVPAGYFKAIEYERDLNIDEIPSKTAVLSPEVFSQQSKPIEMTMYWYKESTATEREMFSQWAFVNRDSINFALDSESKSLQMSGYWFEKATKEERKQILVLLLNQ